MRCIIWGVALGLKNLLDRSSRPSFLWSLGAVVVVGSLAFNYRLLTKNHTASQAETDLNTLKKAVLSYWRLHRLTYPKDVHRTLASSEKAVIQNPLQDPWGTDPKNSTYGYLKAVDPNIGEYFILYTQGPKKDTHPKLNSASQSIEYSGSGIVVSNLPIKKLN